MYEVFSVISNDLGRCCVPTGDGSIDLRTAENLMLKRMIKHPTIEFFIEYVPSEDEFNAY